MYFTFFSPFNISVLCFPLFPLIFYLPRIPLLSPFTTNPISPKLLTVWFMASLTPLKKKVRKRKKASCFYLAHILRFRPHVLLQHEELVPHPAPFNSLKSRRPIPHRAPQTPDVLPPRPAPSQQRWRWTQRKDWALVDENPKEQQQAVPC